MVAPTVGKSSPVSRETWETGETHRQRRKVKGGGWCVNLFAAIRVIRTGLCRM